MPASSDTYLERFNELSLSLKFLIAMFNAGEFCVIVAHIVDNALEKRIIFNEADEAS